MRAHWKALSGILIERNGGQEAGEREEMEYRGKKQRAKNDSISRWISWMSNEWHHEIFGFCVLDRLRATAHSYSLPIYVHIFSHTTQRTAAAAVAADIQWFAIAVIIVVVAFCLAYLHFVHRWLIISRNSNVRGSFSPFLMLLFPFR